MLHRSKDLHFITEALNELSTYEGVKIPSTSNRKTSHFRTQNSATSTNYHYPSTYQEFLTRQQQMHKKGVKQAQELVRKFLPEEFSNLLKSNQGWDCPYFFQKPAGIKLVKTGPPPSEYNKLCVSLSSSADSEAVMRDIEYNDATDIHENSNRDRTDNEEDDSMHMTDDNVENSDSDREDENPIEGVPPSMKWYIEKDGKNVHISRALNLLVPREYISKERSRRHWVGKSLIQAWKEIDDSHNVIRFRDIAIKNKDKVEFLHILSIQSEEGKEQLSASSKAKGSIRGRPYTEVSDGKFDVPYKILLTKWIPLHKVLCEIEMVKNDDGTCSLSEDSKANLQSKEKATPPTSPIVEDRNQDDEYYEVGKVLEVRLNKQFHSEEYRVRFKRYTSEDDMWLPSSAFKETVTFNTVSKRGRIRKHTMKDDSAPLDIPRRKAEPLTEKTSLKRKHFRGPAAGK